MQYIATPNEKPTVRVTKPRVGHRPRVEPTGTPKSIDEMKDGSQRLGNAIVKAFPQVTLLKVLSAGALIEVPDVEAKTLVPQIESLCDCKLHENGAKRAL